MNPVNAVLGLEDFGGIPLLFPKHFNLCASGVTNRFYRLEIFRPNPQVFVVFVADEMNSELLVTCINDPAGVPISFAVAGLCSLADSRIRQRLGLSQDDGKKGSDRVKGIGVRLYIEASDDIDQVAARAKAAGIKLKSEPHDTQWGSRAFEVDEPSGFALTIASRSTQK